MQLPGGPHMSGEARKLIENTTHIGRPARFRSGTEAVDRRIDEIARSGGAGRVRRILEELDVIAGHFEQAAVQTVRSRLAAVLGTFSDRQVAVSGRLAARLASSPYDAHRIEMLEGLLDVLHDRAPAPRAAVPPMRRWEWLAFFEAYFSNFIEGTEFGVDEARRIAVEGLVPEARPEDAHDVSATYRLAVDPVERSRVPRSGEELVGILKERHRVLMAARPDKRPGEFKNALNYAGGYQFVEPDLVEGTLVRGFDVVTGLTGPFNRAVAMMALVTECHPFDDGNGRIARLAANSELSAAGEVRITMPNVYRNNYLAGLSGFSNGTGRGEPLVEVISFAQRWTAAVDWSTFEVSHQQLIACNAYADSGIAEATGQRLLMPR